LYRGIYEKEALCVKEQLENISAGEYPDKAVMLEKFKQIQDDFYNTPLAGYHKNSKPGTVEVVRSLPRRLALC
jgi:hypothetical protein